MWEEGCGGRGFKSPPATPPLRCNFALQDFLHFGDGKTRQPCNVAIEVTQAAYFIALAYRVKQSSAKRLQVTTQHYSALLSKLRLLIRYFSIIEM